MARGTRRGRGGARRGAAAGGEGEGGGEERRGRGWEAERRRGDRARPFSGAEKKKQLQEKRARQRQAAEKEGRGGEAPAVVAAFGGALEGAARGGERSHFLAQDPGELAALRADAVRPFAARPPPPARGALPDWPVTALPPAYAVPQAMPERPQWGSRDSAEELDLRERAAFDEWIHCLEEGGGDCAGGGSMAAPALNNFERNLEVWRQLWRVLEASHILLHIVDARMPLLHFAAPVYEHACRRGVRMVVLLNKADLVPAEERRLWQEYLSRRFPEVQAIIPLTADSQRRGPGRWSQDRAAADAIIESVKVCPVMHGGVRKPAREFFEEDGVNESRTEKEGFVKLSLDEPPGHERDYITVGFIGEPNMGKSSAINLIMGASKVGVGPTPGKTKHLQTHYLRPRVRLCDCPGLVFPKRGVPFALQALCGNFPVSQVREPFSAIRFLEESGAQPPFAEAYNLERPEEHDYSDTTRADAAGGSIWSPYGAAEALAVKMNFLSARGGRPDASRAANRVLRDALAGKGVLLAFRPPPDEPPPESERPTSE